VRGSYRGLVVGRLRIEVHVHGPMSCRTNERFVIPRVTSPLRWNIFQAMARFRTGAIMRYTCFYPIRHMNP
jgi:hypothetical protein